MSITSEQQNNILGVVAGLFDAVPGGQFLADFTKLVEAGTTEAQLADMLAAHPAFTDGIMGGKTTTAAQVAVLMNHYGLVSDGVTGSTASQAEAFFTSRIDSGVGFGAIAAQATVFLQGSSVPSEFIETANLLKNKIKVAEIYSANIFSSTIYSTDLNVVEYPISGPVSIFSFSSTDPATLQAPLLGLSGATLLTQAEATNFLVTNGFLFRVNASSATLNEATIGPLAGPIGMIEAPDTFSLNLISAGKGSAFDVGSNISVILQDAAGTTADGNAETFTLNATIKDSNIETFGFPGIANGIHAQTITVASVENLVISSTVVSTNDSTPYTIAQATLRANLIAPDAETITITGNGGVNLTPVNYIGDIGNVSEINAAGSTGGVAIDLRAHAQSVTFTGSDGADLYFGSTQGDIVTGGKGGDNIDLETGKAARDVLVLKKATDSQISDTNNDGKATLSAADRSGSDRVENFKAGDASTDDRIDVTNFGFTGTQRGIIDVSAKAPDPFIFHDIDITSIPDLFSDTVGDRGVAFSVIMVPNFGPPGGGFFPRPPTPNLYVFIDANKDGDFTAANDIVIHLFGVDHFSEANLIF